jgi:hypothetical protein
VTAGNINGIFAFPTEKERNATCAELEKGKAPCTDDWNVLIY